MNAVKKNINLTINAHLIELAKSYGINMSQLFEHTLKVEADEWKKQNSMAINQYNSHIEKNGLFSDEFRKF